MVTHFMFYDWPELASPDDSTLVIDMIGQLQKTQQMTGNGSIAVHCRYEIAFSVLLVWCGLA